MVTVLSSPAKPTIPTMWFFSNHVNFSNWKCKDGEQNPRQRKGEALPSIGTMVVCPFGQVKASVQSRTEEYSLKRRFHRPHKVNVQVFVCVHTCLHTWYMCVQDTYLIHMYLSHTTFRRADMFCFFSFLFFFCKEELRLRDLDYPLGIILDLTPKISHFHFLFQFSLLHADYVNYNFTRMTCGGLKKIFMVLIQTTQTRICANWTQTLCCLHVVLTSILQ